MESNMVDHTNYLSNDSLLNIIIQYFNENLPSYILQNSYDNGRYFGITFSNGDININISKEIGFWINIVIKSKEYGLWQYDRIVNDFSEPTKENVLFQLNILKDFLN
jgi:hypothetical protein